ncbi:MAG: hypothetical protein ACOH2J_07310 [Allorhizobium sp.]
MSEFRLSFPACVVAGKTCIAAEDIALLQKYTFAEGIRGSDDVVTILALNAASGQKCADWADFFVESLTDYIVHHCYPQGSLDEFNADWLMSVFATDGAVHSPLELKLILNVMREAPFVPDSLTAFALDQLRLALTEQVGGYHQERPMPTAGVTVDDLQYILQILRGSFARGNLVLSQAEIAVLRRIDRETTGDLHHRAWHDMIAAIDLDLHRAENAKPVRWLRVPDAYFVDDQRRA